MDNIDDIEQNSKKVGRSQIILTIIVVIAIVFISLTYKSGNLQKDGVTPENIVIDTAWPSTEVDKVTIDESNKQYDIKTSYPVVKDNSISLIFKSFVENQIQRFKEDTSWVNDENASSESEGELSINIEYRSVRSVNTETYIFTTGTYTGGAHGMQFNSTFTISKLGEIIKVENLFTKKNGLEVVSDYVKAELNKMEYADAKSIESGTSPSVDNYQSFIITNEGVTFLFDPYQVAAYAYGMQKVDVPLSVFKDYANPEIFTR